MLISCKCQYQNRAEWETKVLTIIDTSDLNTIYIKKVVECLICLFCGRILTENPDWELNKQKSSILYPIILSYVICVRVVFHTFEMTLCGSTSGRQLLNFFEYYQALCCSETVASVFHVKWNKCSNQSNLMQSVFVKKSLFSVRCVLLFQIPY